MVLDIVLYLYTFIVSLARYFASSKRDLSSEQSEANDDKKKKREDSSTTSFSEIDDVFLERLKSDDCRSILANCFKKYSREDQGNFYGQKK